MLVALICLADFDVDRQGILTRIEGPQMIQVFKTCDLKCAQIDKNGKWLFGRNIINLWKRVSERARKREGKRIGAKQCIHLYKCYTTKLIGKAAESENN